TRSDHNGTAVLLQARSVEHGQIEVFIAVSGSLDNCDTFCNRSLDCGEDIRPILHRDVFAVRSGCLQLDEDDVAGIQLACGTSNCRSSIENAIDDDGMNSTFRFMADTDATFAIGNCDHLTEHCGSMVPPCKVVDYCTTQQRNARGQIFMLAIP